jgi:hypothetical protein
MNKKMIRERLGPNKGGRSSKETSAGTGTSKNAAPREAGLSHRLASPPSSTSG